MNTDQQQPQKPERVAQSVQKPLEATGDTGATGSTGPTCDTGAGATGPTGSAGTTEATDERPNLRRWGQLVVFAVMIIAVYFFAFEFEGKEIKKVQWDELAAILIVFILAELAVSLVDKSDEIHFTMIKTEHVARQVNCRMTKLNCEARKLRNSVVKVQGETTASLKKAEDDFAEVNTELKGTTSRLDDVIDAITGIVGTKLWYETSRKVRTVLGFYRRKETGDDYSGDYWKSLEIFSESWLPQTDAGHTEHPLLGVLFRLFIGKSPHLGTVRATQKRVSCVTVDSVFVEASEQWLVSMEEKLSQEPEQGLVVWAITTLLPTDFAFPRLWWGEATTHPAAKKMPRRSEKLERFVDIVLKKIRSSSLLEYRRVTVFKEDENSPLAPYGYPTSYNNLMVDELDATLRNWLIWDPRVAQTPATLPPVPDLRYFIESNTTTLARKLLGQQGSEAVPFLDLTWKDLKQYFTEGKDKSYHHNHHILPAAKGFCCCKIETPGSEDCRVIGVEPSLLNRKISSEHLDDSIKAAINNPSPELTFGEFCKFLGWRTLLDWYCDCVHKKDATDQEAAWWVVLRDGQLLEPLELEWEDYHILTLDLILFGKRKREPKSDSEKEIDWSAAAISNLDVDRTECTVQMVTEDLKKIEDCLRKVTGDFGKKVDFDTLEQGGIRKLGRWRKWPRCDYPADRGRREA